jgi:hypothetical protein
MSNPSRLRIPVLTLSALIIFLLLTVNESSGWGFWAHREIHRHAIKMLPAPLEKFFKKHADSLIARSVEPDLRRGRDSLEQYYHYIDFERYGTYPFEALPRDYEAAVKKFGKRTVDTNGTLPWRIADFTNRLSDAMKRRSEEEIVFYASFLGHYIADANVPLHTTENYDGQLSGQRGIHSRWESRLPEKYGSQFQFDVGKVEYIADPLAYAFEIVLESHRLVDSVLAMDQKAKEGLAESEIYTVTQRRGRSEYQYSDLYYERYYKLLNGMIERRMAASAQRVASYWYTAWINAGKPQLP